MRIRHLSFKLFWSLSDEMRLRWSLHSITLMQFEPTLWFQSSVGKNVKDKWRNLFQKCSDFNKQTVFLWVGAASHCVIRVPGGEWAVMNNGWRWSHHHCRWKRELCCHRFSGHSRSSKGWQSAADIKSGRIRQISNNEQTSRGKAAAGRGWDEVK